MARYVTDDGQIYDTETGVISGQVEAPVAQNKLDIPTTAMDVARQASYAFNAALFTLPDAAVRRIGKGLGLEENEVQTLTKIFNKGDRGPKNAAERYARAIGGAIGANMPITGVLGYMATGLSKPFGAASQAFAGGKTLANPLMADAGVLKRVAKDTLDFIRKNPKAAFAADIGSGAAFGAVEQYTKEEEMSPFAQMAAPLVASVAGPAAVGTLGTLASKLPLPSVMAFKYGKQLVDPTTAEGKLTQVGNEIADEYNVFMRPAARMLVGRAEKKAGQALGHGETQIALQEAEQLIADLGAQGIKLNTAERTMLPYFIKEQGAAVRGLAPEQLRAELQRRADNMNNFGVVMEKLSPKSNLSAEDALVTIRSDAEGLQQKIMQQIGDEKGLEAERLADRFTPMNRDVLGNEIRETILGAGEQAFFNLRNVQERMGLRMNFTKDGVPLPTRDAAGVSLFQSTNIEKPVNEILQKYNVLTGPIKEYAPGLVKVLGRYKQRQKAKGESAYDEALQADLTSMFTSRKRPSTSQTADFLDPQEVARSSASADRDFLAMQQMNARSLVNEIAEMKKLGINIDTQMDSIASRYGITGADLRNTIKGAEATAAKAGQVDINFPEAVELLQATTSYRNNAIRGYTDAQLAGKDSLAARKNLDKANALHKDISDMLFKAVPKLGNEYKTFRQAYDDIYGGTYDRYLPLVLGAKRPTGEFLTPNEAVVAQAFKSGENMKELSILLRGTPQGDELLTKSTMDWLSSKNILDKDGIVDPRKLSSVLTANKNIVEALPQPLQTALKDELTTGQAFAARMGQLERRKEAVIDAELDRLLARISREGAEPGPILERALQNPADMKSLVNAVKDKPELLEALRRGVYQMAGEQFGEKSITTFLETANKRSLSFLFAPEQLTNLRKLGELEKRIRVSEGITDTPKPFETTDEALQRISGVSIRNISTLYRGMSGAGGYKASPMDAGIYLGMRLIGRQEYGIMDRVMQRAITDPDFAKALVDNAQQQSMQKEMAKFQKKLYRDGVYIPEVVFKAPQRATMIGIAEDLQEEPPTAAPAPVAPQPAPAPQPTAREMMQNMNKQQPPAPPTRGPQIIPAAPERNKLPPQAPRSGNAAQMYQALFPNDTLGNIIQQQKQMPQ
jgi:hypothetical protein